MTEDHYRYGVQRTYRLHGEEHLYVKWYPTEDERNVAFLLSLPVLHHMTGNGFFCKIEKVERTVQ